MAARQARRVSWRAGLNYSLSAACIADPDMTLFWDGIHLTAAGHALIARAALAATISEPSSLALLLIVGFVFGARRVVRSSLR